MAKLRFPNPGSDIERLTHVFSLVALASEGTDPFDLDFMTDVVTAEGQASSQGAHGAMAVTRSRRDDRSRDPLYNQLKMYSEIYRMLGWMRPLPDSRLTFTTTILGDTVGIDTIGDRRVRAGLVRESLLSIVFPNVTTENIGVRSQRPFTWLLRLASELGGVITRHEMILGLLAQTDDTAVGALDAAVQQIRVLRSGPIQGLRDAAGDFARTEAIQLNTLENYTRFPVGVLTSTAIGWGASESVRGLYSGQRPVVAIRLSPSGEALAKKIPTMVDVRSTQLASVSTRERADLASLAFYVMLSRAGFSRAEVADPLAKYSDSCRSLLTTLGVTDPLDLLFSPFVQESDKILNLAQQSEPQ